MSNLSKIFLSVIIPVRTSWVRRIDEFIKHPLFDSNLPDKLEFVIIDDGSEDSNRIINENICKQHGFRYIHMPTCKKKFNLARARNEGAKVARGEYIFFQDADLVPYIGFYHDLFQSIEDDIKAVGVNDLITIPIMHFSQEYSEKIRNQGSLSKREMLDCMINKTDSVLNILPYSSAVAINRKFYLNIGGQNEVFEGWGYEDWEFSFRVLCHAHKFSKPDNYRCFPWESYKRLRNLNNFKGLIAKYGVNSFARGLVMGHLYHAIDDEIAKFEDKRLNRQRFYSLQPNALNSLYYLPKLVNDSNSCTCFIGQFDLLFERDLYIHFDKVEVFASPKDFYSSRKDLASTYGNISFILYNPSHSSDMFHLYSELMASSYSCHFMVDGPFKNTTVILAVEHLNPSQLFDEKIWNNPTPSNVKNILVSLEKMKTLLSKHSELDNDKLSRLSYHIKYKLRCKMLISTVEIGSCKDNRRKISALWTADGDYLFSCGDEVSDFIEKLYPMFGKGKRQSIFRRYIYSRYFGKMFKPLRFGRHEHIKR